MRVSLVRDGLPSSKSSTFQILITSNRHSATLKMTQVRSSPDEHSMLTCIISQLVIYDIAFNKASRTVALMSSSNQAAYRLFDYDTWKLLRTAAWQPSQDSKFTTMCYIVTIIQRRFNRYPFPLMAG